MTITAQPSREEITNALACPAWRAEPDGHGSTSVHRPAVGEANYFRSVDVWLRGAALETEQDADGGA